MSIVRAYYGSKGARHEPFDSEIKRIASSNGGELLTEAMHANGDCLTAFQFQNEDAAKAAADRLLERGYIVTDGAWMRKHSGSVEQAEAA